MGTASNFSSLTAISDNSTLFTAEVWFIPFDVLMIFCLSVTIILDSLFLAIITLDKTCRTVPMILVANTCLTLFLTAMNELFINMFTLQHDIHQSQYQDSLCDFRGYFGYVTVAMMNYSFMLQAFYRYITVVYPARLCWQTSRTQTILILISWILCVVFPLPCLFNHNIEYNIPNQVCLLSLGPSVCVIYLAPSVYLFPVTTIIFLYLKLVRYVKMMNNRVTPVNILSRAERELHMVKQIVILIQILLTLGIPLVLFVLISFFTDPPKYHYRIALIFIEMSFPGLAIALFYFTDPLKASVKKIFAIGTNRVATSMT